MYILQIVLWFCLTSTIRAQKCNITNLQIDCHNLTLTDFPDVFPRHVSAINISYNYIKHIAVNDLDKHRDLVLIDARGNIIKQLELGLFYNHPTLKTLILENNVLSSFNSSSIFGPNNELFTLNVRKNNLTNVDFTILSRLKVLNLDGNYLSSVTFSVENVKSLDQIYLNDNYIKDLIFPENCHNLTISFEMLSLKNNGLKDLSFLSKCQFPLLMELNLANNHLSYLNSLFFWHVRNLKLLILDGNDFLGLSNYVFSSLPHLNELHLNNLSRIRHISDEVFHGVVNITHLEISKNIHLSRLEWEIFKNLTQLEYLDVSYNNLTYIDLRLFKFLDNLKFLGLSNNSWHCDCSMSYLTRILKEKVSEGLVLLGDAKDLPCSTKKDLNGTNVDELLNSSEVYQHNVIPDKELNFKLGSAAVLDCQHFEDIDDDDDDDDDVKCLWAKVSWSGNETNYLIQDSNSTLSTRYFVLPNGSLVINDVRSGDVGIYKYCLSHWKGLEGTVYLKLDYEILRETELISLLCGLISAVSFLSSAIVFGGIRVCSKSCSEKERKKKNSLQEVLQALRSSFQLDRLQSYKSAQLERFTAFRSTTKEQLTAFRIARVSRMRKYKQATLNSVLHCLERMRIHYSGQTLKIKSNCQMQFEKLRENYTGQRNKFRDNRSQQVRRVREHYHNQALRIKDYSSQQLAKLRQQYKHQQQNLMKLLELLEVGNCVNFIEAECSRTESIIFDSDLTCELDVQPNDILELDARDIFLHNSDDVFDFNSPLSFERDFLKVDISDPDLSLSELHDSNSLIEVIHQCTSEDGCFSQQARRNNASQDLELTEM